MLEQRRFAESVISYAAPEDSAPKRAMIRLVERLSGRKRLVRAYEQARRQLGPGANIWALAVDHLDLRLRCDLAPLAQVPATGPLVVVANHPFGVVDGLVLCHLAAQVRSDVKVVAMSTLCRLPELRDHVLPINFAGTREAIQASARARRAARAHLASGGCLIIFPAGGVSTARPAFAPAQDAPWHPFAGRLILDHKAAVLPVRFVGQNGMLFHLVSQFSLTLRLSLLMQEAAKRIGTEIEAHLGEVLAPADLAGFPSPEALVQHLRAVTYALPGRPAPAASPSAA
jgi:putative hemolysin